MNGNINKETAMAFIRLLCSVIASGATMVGFALDADALFTGAALVLAIIAYVWSWWKNNNVTQAAIEAQGMLDLMKKGNDDRRDPEDVEEGAEG